MPLSFLRTDALFVVNPIIDISIEVLCIGVRIYASLTKESDSFSASRIQSFQAIIQSSQRAMFNDMQHRLDLTTVRSSSCRADPSCAPSRRLRPERKRFNIEHFLREKLTPVKELLNPIPDVCLLAEVTGAATHVFKILAQRPVTHD